MENGAEGEKGAHELLLEGDLVHSVNSQVRPANAHAMGRGSLHSFGLGWTNGSQRGGDGSGTAGFEVAHLCPERDVVGDETLALLSPRAQFRAKSFDLLLVVVSQSVLFRHLSGLVYGSLEELFEHEIDVGLADHLADCHEVHYDVICRYCHHARELT